MAQKIVDIPGIGEVTLVKRHVSRNLRLSFGRDGRPRVSLPYWLPYQAGVDFASAKRDWIANHQPNPLASLSDGDRIGKAHRLRIIRNSSRKGQNARVTVRNNLVTVSCPVDVPSTHQSVQQAAQRGAHKALKAEADRLLPQRLRQLAYEHGFSYKSVGTKRLGSRWGSCSQHRDIILNTYLMQLPWELIDYVILHELVHTEHLNHSAGFWQRFEQVLPDARVQRKALKTYKTAVTAG